MSRLGFRTACVLAIVGTAGGISACESQPRTSLNVAIFAYLPAANAAIERFEEAFEAKNPTINLELELWDPYRDETAKDGLDQMPRFDVVEIDVCRLDEILANPKWALDELPESWRGDASKHIEPARALLSTPAARHVVPHWVCANFITFWSDNQSMANVRTFDDFTAAIDPAANRPLLIDLFGKSGLGDFYADALLDLYGADAARKQLQALAALPAGQPVVLDDTAKQRVIALATECTPKYRANLEYFHDHGYVYPRDFAGNHNAVLIGYSERLYYAERELQLTPNNYPPCIKKDTIVVRPMSFGDKSNGTPSWVDGFVIPSGKLAAKKAAIQSFMEFVQSAEGYAAFVEPEPFLAASYLLPATSTAYQGDAAKKQPCLEQYRDQLDSTFPVFESKTWRGMRRAGEELETLVVK